jgi:branched-chain amino acid transport system substrate-binding protein
MLNKAAVTKLQAVIIAVIIIVACVVGGVYYYMVSKGPALPAKSSVVVGWVHSITGVLAGQTATFDIYYKWIIDDYNANGGLYVPEYGKKLNITYIEYNDESDINKMLSLTEKLITVDNVDLIFPPVSTAFNYAAFPTYQKYHYPVVALTFGSDIAADKMRTGEYSYCFSVLGFPSETGDQVTSLFKYINASIAPLKSVGIIYHADQHGVEYSSAMYADLSLSGFDVPVHESYPPTIADFTPLINTLKAANVDVVILAGYEGALFIHQSEAQGYNPKLLVVGPSMETPLLVFGPYGLKANEIRGVTLYDGWPATAYNTPELKAWADAHYKRAGWYPFPASATFYAGLDCLFHAVEKVGLNKEKIRDELATDTFTTIVGQTKLRQGYSMQCELAGTITQWQGGNMCQVIWPRNASSADIIYPKPSWPSS